MEHQQLSQQVLAVVHVLQDTIHQQVIQHVQFVQLGLTQVLLAQAVAHLVEQVVTSHFEFNKYFKGYYGTFSGATSSSDCVGTCIAGYYSSEGDSACTICPTGTYSLSSAASSCTSCSAGILRCIECKI